MIQFEGAVERGVCISLVAVNSVGMSLGGGGVGNRESAVMSGGRGASAGSGGAS